MLVTRLVAVIVLCTSAALAQNGAVLWASTPVSVNGLQTRSVALAAGDKIATGESALTSITEPGSDVMLGKQTSSTIDVHKLVLHQGSATVLTDSSFAVQIESVVIAPVRTGAHYSVSRSNCQLFVSALDTPLTLSDGPKASTVQAHESVARAIPNCIAKAEPSATPAPAVSGAAVDRGALIMGGAAAGGTGLAAALSSSEPKASPSRPH